jgi:capsular polysaccharide biosynthesis protein
MIRLVLLRFLENYYRHRWLYLLPILLLLIVAGISVATEKPQYLAHGNVFVQKQSLLASLNSVRSNDNTWWVSPAQTTANELNELLRTDAFIRAVIHSTDLEANMSKDATSVEDTITKTRKNIWVSTLGDNQVQINGGFELPQVAEQAVGAVIESYIQWQINGQRAESESAQAFFAVQIKKYQVDLENARQNMKNYLLANPSPLQGDRPDIEKLEVSRLQKDIDLAESRYTSALDKEENARLALAQIESDTRQSYTIIDAPRLPDKPEFSRKDIAVRFLVYLAIGIVLSIAAVAGGQLLDHSFNLPLDVQYGINLPVLAVIPDANEYLDWFQKLLRWMRKSIKTITGKKAKKETGENLDKAIEMPVLEVTPKENAVADKIKV